MTDIDPNIPTVSPSQVRKYMNCPQEWFYGYRDNLKKLNAGSFHMDRGTYVHRNLHYYYNLLQTGYRPGSPTVLAAMDAKLQEDMKQVTPDIIKLLSTSIPVFRQYLSQRSPEIDRDIKVLAVEKEYHVLLTLPSGRQVYLHGIIDLVYRDIRGKINVRDHKTGERSDSHSIYKVLLDDQLLHYNLALWLETGEEIGGVEINFINLAANPKTRFDMFGTYHSETALKNFQANLIVILEKMLDEEVYRRYSPDCGSCAFSKLCQLEIKGMSTVSTISTQYERTNRGHKPGLIPSTETEETLHGQPEGNSVNQQSNDFLIVW